jgi:nucleoid-associated protein YgaU
VLQAPTGGQNARLAFAAVDYDDRGELRFAGTAPPGAPVRVYIDNRMAGDATADAQGRWTLSPSASVAPGAHHLRLDQIDRRGAVVARVEVPFQREQLTADALGGNRIVVQPGESLWRLARQTYGSGLRYTVIYQANQTQLRSPDKIYPGQTLTMPQDAAQQSR